MNENLFSMLIIAGELLLALAVFVSIVLFRVSRRRRENESLARNFVESFKASEQERLHKLRQVLKDTYNFDDQTLDRNAEALMALEKTLYARFVKIFLGKDRQGLLELHTQIEQLLEGYCGMVPEPDQPAVSDEEAEELKRTVEELKQKNERLEFELGEANDAMDQMLREYVSIYGGTRDDARRKLAAEGQSQPDGLPTQSGGSDAM